MKEFFYSNYNMIVNNYIKRDSYYILYIDSFYIFKSVKHPFNLKFNLINRKYNSIVLSKYNKPFVYYNNNIFALFKLNFHCNRYVLLDDIYGNYNSIYKVHFSSLNWIIMWKNKIDNLENYLNNNHLNIGDLSIINYFIGLAELSISYLQKCHYDYIDLDFCHRRLSFDDDLYTFYDLDSIYIDNISRDIGEYIKSIIYKYKKLNINYNSYLFYKYKDLIISRVLFPSIFFDYIDNVIVNNIDINNLKEVFNIELIEDGLNDFFRKIKKS